MAKLIPSWVELEDRGGYVIHMLDTILADHHGNERDEAETIEKIRKLIAEFLSDETVDVVAVLAETDHHEGKHDRLSRPWCPRCQSANRTDAA